MFSIFRRSAKGKKDKNSPAATHTQTQLSKCSKFENVRNAKSESATSASAAEGTSCPPQCVAAVDGDDNNCCYAENSVDTTAGGRSDSNSATNTSSQAKAKERSKFNPIEKSRALFNDIIMAKGRNRNHRNNNRHFQNVQNGGNNGNNKNGASNQKNSNNNKKSFGLVNNSSDESQPKLNNIENENSDYQITARAKNNREHLENSDLQLPTAITNASTIGNAGIGGGEVASAPLCAGVEGANGNSSVTGRSRSRSQDQEFDFGGAADCSELTGTTAFTDYNDNDCSSQERGPDQFGSVVAKNALSEIAASESVEMGQSNTKEAPAAEFRESRIPAEQPTQPKIVIPAITVDDFSDDSAPKSTSPKLDDDDTFFEFEPATLKPLDEDWQFVKSVETHSDSPDSGISSKVLLIDSCDLITDRPQFVRDGNSTDCEENLVHDFDYFNDGSLIESISLPDVVVAAAPAPVNASPETHIIIPNSAGAKDNVHYIPIQVEKRASVDDSVINCKVGGGGALFGRSTLVITEEEDKQKDIAYEEKKRDLVNQEARFTAQLEDAQKTIYKLQEKINELQAKIDDLEKELSLKSWNVDRLQGELEAAHKEDECVRRRLKILEEEKKTLRDKHFEAEEEFTRKFDDLDAQYKDLDEKYKTVKSLASNLQTQLATAQSDQEQCRQDAEKLREEKNEELKKLQEALNTSQEEQKAREAKWQQEFETLRTQNADREEHLMTDCEWQLRSMQKVCKEKIDSAEKAKNEALQRSAQIETEAQQKLDEVNHLKSYEAEVTALRGLTCDQRLSLTAMTEQIDELKTDLEAANRQLEEQIECVKTIKRQSEVALSDKEREMIQRIDDVRGDAAEQWENKLITEMTRLKVELESVYIEDRRNELDKLHTEHIEELKALTNRYTANEEELRNEVADLKAKLEARSEDFQQLREKSDSAILQTRMHLDRADRDYQTAMCREEEKREKLAADLKAEFEKEKQEMEEKFRERLGQVKNEFSREISHAQQELSERHRKQLEQQYEQLTAEKEEALHDMEARQRNKLSDAENRIKNIELEHQRDLKQLKCDYDIQRSSSDKREMSNSQEIEQLHRKCRCLTNLFEEMRMRYERRDPRPEDLQEISKLRSRCESQERDLCILTERLREMQMQMEELQGSGDKKSSKLRKPPPKTIPTNCDVIYEESEERDSPQPSLPSADEEDTINEDDAVAALKDEESQKAKLINTNGIFIESLPQEVS